MENTHLEIVKVFGIYTIIVLYVLDRAKEKKWLKILPFLNQETGETIEKKLFGFDKAINPKYFTDENGIITNVNKSAEDLLGWKEKELIGQHITIIFPKSETKTWNDTISKNKGFKMDQAKSFKLPVVRKGGGDVQVEILLRKEVLNDSYFYLFILKDRTEEIRMVKMHEQLLKKYSLKLALLNKGEELGNTGSWIWDLDDNTITATDGYKRIIGADMKGPNTFDANELRGRVLKGYEKVVEGALSRAFAGKMYDITYEQKRPSDFKIIKIRSIVEPILNEAGTPIVFYGNTTKISDRDVTE